MIFKIFVKNSGVTKEYNTKTGKGFTLYPNCNNLKEKSNIHYYYALDDKYFQNENIKNTLYIIIFPWSEDTYNIDREINFTKHDVYKYFLYVPVDDLKILFQMFKDALNYSYKPIHLKNAYNDIKNYIIKNRKEDFILINKIINMENKLGE